jgi:hypothetical protein
MPSGVHFFAVSIIVVVIAILRDEQAAGICGGGICLRESVLVF